MFDRPHATIYRFPVAAKAQPSATEESGATPTAPVAGAEVKESPRGFLQAARRNLTEEEAASPAGVRWLTHDVERLDQECIALRKELQEIRGRYEHLQTQYNDKRVEVEGLKTSSRISIRNEALSYLCFSAGSAGLGATASFFTVPGAFSYAVVALIISAVLILGGIFLRVWK